MVTNLGPVVLATVPLLLAGTLRGITGFGLLLVATPLLFLLFPPKLVIAALVVPTMVSNLTVLWRDGLPRDHLASHTTLYLSGAIGAVVGVAGLVVLDRRTIFLIVAGYIVAYLGLKRWGDGASWLAGRRGMSVVAGGSGGLLGGTVGLSGPPIVTYLHAKPLGKRPFVGLLAVYFLAIDVVRIPSMAAAGLFGVPELVLGAWFTVPTAVGTYAGAVLRPRVPQDRFELVVEVFLLTVAAKLVLDGLSI